MSEFINRQPELRELDRLAAEPGGQFVMVYGRRRVGKTTLLVHWAARTGLPIFYWVAKRESRTTLMANLAQHLWSFEHGGQTSEIRLRPQDWDAVLAQLGRVAAARGAIVILDELPYLIESDPSFLSYLQAAWDHRLRETQIRLFVSGSHIGMMTQLLEYQAPLYGRFTAQLPVQPLDFCHIAPFLPGYDRYQRLAVYAVLGGIPAYLERWHSQEPLAANLERLFFQRTGWFRNEPAVLVSDLTRRETEVYEGVLRAIAEGGHTRTQIAEAVGMPSTALSHYLPRLIELGLCERRVPATVPPARRKSSKDARYYLRDSYLRFYYRFVDANLHLIEQGLVQKLWERMHEQFRAFVGETFEDLARAWTLHQAQRGRLPLSPEVVGAHWAKDAQVDVVAIDWRGKQILLGEAKWGQGKVGREVIREHVAKVPLVVPDSGEGWQVRHAFFAREGFTEAARGEAAQHGALLLDLMQMEEDLMR